MARSWHRHCDQGDQVHAEMKRRGVASFPHRIAILIRPSLPKISDEPSRHRILDRSSFRTVPGIAIRVGNEATGRRFISA